MFLDTIPVSAGAMGVICYLKYQGVSYPLRDLYEASARITSDKMDHLNIPFGRFSNHQVSDICICLRRSLECLFIYKTRIPSEGVKKCEVQLTKTRPYIRVSGSAYLPVPFKTMSTV